MPPVPFAPQPAGGPVRRPVQGQQPLPQQPQQPAQAAGGSLLPQTQGLGQGDLGISNPNVWGQQQMQNLGNTAGRMLSGMQGTLGQFGLNPAMMGNIGNALQGGLLRNASNVARQGQITQGKLGLEANEAQQRAGSNLANMLGQFGLTGDPETDAQLQASLGGLYTAGLGGGGGPSPAGGGGMPGLPAGAGAGGGFAPPAGGGGGGAPFAGAGAGGGGMPPGAPGGGLGGGGGAPGGAPRGRDVNAMANNQDMAQAQNQAIGGMLQGGRGGFSGASPGIQQQQGFDFGNLLQGAMGRLNENNLGYNTQMAQLGLGQETLKSNALQNYLAQMFNIVPQQFQMTYGV